MHTPPDGRSEYLVPGWLAAILGGYVDEFSFLSWFLALVDFCINH
jgi:hypothetical protein